MNKKMIIGIIAAVIVVAIAIVVVLFLGKGNLANPEALKKVILDKENSIGNEAIVAIELNVELEAFETKKIAFTVGTEKNKIDAQDKNYKYIYSRNLMKILLK